MNRRGPWLVLGLLAANSLLNSVAIILLAVAR